MILLNRLSFDLVHETAFCTQHGFSSGCDLYDSDLVFGHYQSLNSRELSLEFITILNENNGQWNVGSQLNVTFIGDEVFQQDYDVTINGVASGTVMNPIQRAYLEQTTYNFLDNFSGAKPHQVDIGQTFGTGNRLLRGQFDEAFWETRHLQDKGVVKAVATVYGVDSNRNSFLTELEKAFIKNTKQYKEEVQKDQYLPGPINDQKNMGEIFAGITGITVKRATRKQSSTTGSPPTSAHKKLNSAQIQIIVFSCTLGLAFFWLVYRVMKDCILVENGWAIKKQRLSEKIDRDEANSMDRLELANMDKPRQSATTQVDIRALSDLKFNRSNDDSTVGTKDSGLRRGRKPPMGRVVGRAKSNDDMEFFPSARGGAKGGGSQHQRDVPIRGVARTKSGDSTELNRRAEPTRGVGRTKSADIDLMFGSRSAHGRPDTLTSRPDTLTSRSAHGRPEPSVRGVSRAKNNDDMDFGRSRPISSLSAHGPANPSRGVARSKSNDVMGMFGTNGRAAGGSGPPANGRPAPTARGVQKSSTFSGVEGFLGGGAPKRPSFLLGGGKSSGANVHSTIKSTSTAGNDETKKKKGKKTKKVSNDEGSPTTKKKKRPKSNSMMFMESKSSASSNGTRGFGEKKKKAAGEKGKPKTKKNNNLGNSTLPGVPNGRPPRPPTRVDMSGSTH